MTLAQFEEGLRKEHERRARVAAEKAREKQRIETDIRHSLVRERRNRYWKSAMNRRRTGRCL